MNILHKQRVTALAAAAVLALSSFSATAQEFKTLSRVAPEYQNVVREWTASISDDAEAARRDAGLRQQQESAWSDYRQSLSRHGWQPESVPARRRAAVVTQQGRRSLEGDA